MSDDVAQAKAQAATEGAHRVAHAHVVADVAPRTAVLLRDIRKNKTQFTGLEPRRTIGEVLLTPLQFIGLHVFLAEAHDHVVERLQVLGHPRGAVIFQHCKHLKFLGLLPAGGQQARRIVDPAYQGTRRNSLRNSNLDRRRRR
ncbi:hypothetical protein D3C72_1882370 [compost metagenome]